MDKKDISSIIAKNVRHLMNKKNLSSAELSKRCGIPTGTISKIINNGMNITISTAVTLANGLAADLGDVLFELGNFEESQINYRELTKVNYHIGILSIDNKRLTCIKDIDNLTIGTSELYGGLDLAESTSSISELINESITAALPKNSKLNKKLMQNSSLNLVTQSYEFEETRKKFQQFLERKFNIVRMIPDWQITYFSAFDNAPGISLVVDKGVSLSYMDNGNLKKIGGWKFPVYDLGGENWLGQAAIHHTIEAIEGFTKPTELARQIISKFNGKIEKITEICFKNRDPDIYRLFCDITLKAYGSNDATAKKLIKKGFQLVERSLHLADSIIGKPLKITLNGSLASTYRPFLPKERLMKHNPDSKNSELLTQIDEQYLQDHGVNS